METLVLLNQRLEDQSFLLILLFCRYLSKSKVSPRHTHSQMNRSSLFYFFYLFIYFFNTTVVLLWVWPVGWCRPRFVLLFEALQKSLHWCEDFVLPSPSLQAVILNLFSYFDALACEIIIWEPYTVVGSWWFIKISRYNVLDVLEVFSFVFRLLK